MPAIAVTVEGVLRKVAGGQPIAVGVDLYYGLATRAKLILLTDELETARDELEHWLRVEGMNEHAQILWNDPVWGIYAESPDTRRVHQCNRARLHGHVVDLVVEANPLVSAALIESGYNVLTFSHAEYSVPAWRPDYKFKPAPWDQLVQRVEREAELRAADERRDNEG